MEDEGSNALPYAALMLVAATAVAAIITVYHAYVETDRAKGQLASVEEVAMMRYRGVPVAMETHTGAIYFHRDGQNRCLAPCDAVPENRTVGTSDHSEPWPVSSCCYEDLITAAEAERLRTEFDEIAMEMAAERRIAA